MQVVPRKVHSRCNVSLQPSSQVPSLSHIYPVLAASTLHTVLLFQPSQQQFAHLKYISLNTEENILSVKSRNLFHALLHKTILTGQFACRQIGLLGLFCVKEREINCEILHLKCFPLCLRKCISGEQTVVVRVETGGLCGVWKLPGQGICVRGREPRNWAAGIHCTCCVPSLGPLAYPPKPQFLICKMR